MVKVARIHALGGPDVISVDDVPMPEPGKGEVRVRGRALGLNRIEAIYRAGGFGLPALPALIGYEAAGEVDKLGAGVSGLKIGDKVVTVPGLSMEQYGVSGEYFLYPADMLIASAPDQSFAQAAATWMAFFTAYTLVEERPLQASDYVVLTAASSSVALAALQIVNAAGATAIAVTRTPDKVETLKKLGAQHVIVSQQENVADRIMAITGGSGARIAFDAVAGDMLPTLATAMAPAGEIIVYGALSNAEAPIPVHMMMLNNLRVRGFSANPIMTNAARRARAVEFIRAGLQSGQFAPVIAKSFPLEEIAAAHAYLESNAQLGKVVVTIG